MICRRWSTRRLTKALDELHHPYEEGSGLVVSATALGDAGLFQLEGEHRWLLCTDEVKRFFQARECTNIGFLRAGNVVE